MIRIIKSLYLWYYDTKQVYDLVSRIDVVLCSLKISAMFDAIALIPWKENLYEQ